MSIRRTIHFCIPTLLTIFIITTAGKEFPHEQQFCDIHPQGWDFFKFHKTRMYRYRCWFCVENYTYVDRINLCADMYGRSVGGEVLSFDIPQKTETDDGAYCERRITYWYEVSQSSLEHLLYSNEEEIPKTELGLDVFKCPITQMNVKLKPAQLVVQNQKTKCKTKTKAKAKAGPPAPRLKDFYMSVGRNLITLAVLTPDDVQGNNLCIRDVHFYPECDDRIGDCFDTEGEWED